MKRCSNSKERIRSSEITPEHVFLNRRDFLGKSVALLSGSLAVLPLARSVGLQKEDEVTPEEIVTSYNNFYEFGTNKSDPVKYANELVTDPWTVTVSGKANRTGEFAFEDVVKGIDQEERVYRFRCVEAWSMVVPWVGISLKRVLDQFEPHGDAKYVEFKTLYRPSQMRGQRSYFF